MYFLEKFVVEMKGRGSDSEVVLVRLVRFRESAKSLRTVDLAEVLFFHYRRFRTTSEVVANKIKIKI